jgi:hypothetical protein
MRKKPSQVKSVDGSREIAESRKAVYIMTDEERAAVSSARQSRLISEDEMVEFWRSRGIV